MQKGKNKIMAYLSVLLCIAMVVTGLAGFAPVTVKAAENNESIHVYASTPGDIKSTKYVLTANGTDVPVIKYQANGNNFDIARFSSDDATPKYVVNVPNEEIETITVYPERYYPQDSITVSEDKHSATFTLSDQLRYCFVMINGGPADQAGKPYLAIINDPTETEKPDVNASNVLNFRTFMEEYLSEHPNLEAQEAESAGVTSGGVAYEAGKLVDNSTSQVRYPDKRKMTEDDATYALQAALDEIYKEGSSYDTLYFPAGTYTYSGLEIRNRNGKHVTIYVEEGALLKNRIQECMQAMEPAIGIWDSSDITISGRGIFDGNGVENYKKDRHDAKDSCHQGGVMIVRSSNITFNDTYVRDTKQWNWESHGSKNCTLNNVKGLTPYNQPWIDGLNMASGQNITINGALTLGNDDNFASGHYNPSDGFTNTVPGYDQYNSDCLEWDTEDSFDISVNNTLGWSYSGGNGIRMGANTYGHQMKNYSFTNVNTTNFTGGGRGITVQNSTGTYPRYEEITFVNCSFDTTRVGRNFQILGKTDMMIDQVTLENCWFSNGDAVSEAQNIKNLTITDLYVGGEKVKVSNLANLTTNNITNFEYDWKVNTAPEFTAPVRNSYTAKVGEEVAFQVTVKDTDGDAVTVSVKNLPDGAKFDEGSGAFTWTPSEEQMGTVIVTFTAIDSKDVKSEKKITLTISDKVGNTAPEITGLQDSAYSVKVGETLKVQVNAEDVDGDAVTLSVDGRMPTGADFDAETGVFTWKPSSSQTGTQEVTFKATDKWGASSKTTVAILVDSGNYKIISVSTTEDTYLASWKDEKKNNYEGNEYLRVRRMNSSADNFDSYGLWGEKITSTSDAGDAKISILKFDAAELKQNLTNLEKAELELTLINRRDNTSTGTDRMMAAEVMDDWSSSDVTWLTYPAWNIENIKYSEEFAVDTKASVKNNVAITASSYDGTKVVIDVTDFVKNLTEDDDTLSIAVCDEKGYELAFASTEGAAKLDDEKAAAPVLRVTVKKELGPEVVVGQLPVNEDSFAGSWSGDQTKNFGSSNFLRVAYGSDSKGVLGTESGGDNKVTYLKFDISELDVNEFDRVKLQLTLLGVRYNAAANQEAELLVGVAEGEWTEGELTWKNKPQMATAEADLSVSELIKLGTVVNNDPAKINTPDGAVGTVDVTEFVKAAKEEGKESLTLVVNMSDSNDAMTEGNANRIYFVSKEGAQKYANATDMAPVLVLTKYSSDDEPVLNGIEVSAPDKTKYMVGETLDTTGMKVNAVYSDGTKKEVSVEEVEVNGFDSKTTGKKSVIVTWKGQKATFTVSIIETYEAFTPNSQWLDTDGEMIQAHGGGVIWDENTQKYYWYGENKGEEGFSAAIGISCYSSTDLYNWDYEGMALPVFNNPAFLGEDYTDDTPMYLAESSEEYQAAKEAGAAVSAYDTLEKYNSAEEIEALNRLYDGMSAENKKALYDLYDWDGVVERPKVIYNEKTQKYVMWFHKDGEGVGKYVLAQTGIAVSDSPTGPFKLVNCINPNDSESRDMTLFKDEDGKAYLIYSSEDNWTLHIAELNDEYTGLTGKYSRNYTYQGGSKGVFAREAPAIFKHDGYYYLISSGCTGWDPNQMGYSVTNDITIGMTEDGGNGPFQFENNQMLLSPCVGTDADISFGGQSTYVLPLQGKEGCFIYMGDKWNKNNLKDSRYQWLPILVDSENQALTISWRDSWTLDDFDGLDKWLAQQNLNAAIEDVESCFAAEYTTETWEKVQKAYDAAKNLGEDASVEEILTATDAIKDALGKLEKETVELENYDLTGKKIVADSQQTSANNQAEKAIDGDENTHWHSAWGNGATELPHHLTIDLGEEVDNLYELIYLPRQDKDYNGIAAKYRILVSNADKELSELTEEDFVEVRSGEWEDDKSEKSAVFVTDGAVRFIRFEVLEGYGGYASAAEIKLNVKKQQPPVLTEIKIQEKPAKTVYKLGEELDLDGMVLVAVYSDGSTVNVALEEVEVTGFDSSKAGEVTVSVIYKGVEETFLVSVEEPEEPGEPEEPVEPEEPGEPEEPVEPEEPGEPEEPDKNPSDAVQTGDNNLIGFYVTVMLMSAFVLGIVVVLKRKKY